MRIKEHRKAAGLTQEEFSELFGISVDTVKAWDCGRRKPDKLKEAFILDKLEKLEKERRLNMNLKNNFDKDIYFNNLQVAKNYLMPEENELAKEDYIGDDYEKDAKSFVDYKTGIAESKSLEELASILNRYSDIFGNGSEWNVE